MAAGGMQAIGQYQGQQAQVAAANRSAASNYKYQMKMREQQWNRERLRYATQVKQYNQTAAENKTAYSRAVSEEQTRLNNAYKLAAFSNQNQFISFLKNFALAGGFLFVVVNGTKDWAVDKEKKYVRL